MGKECLVDRKKVRWTRQGFGAEQGFCWPFHQLHSSPDNQPINGPTRTDRPDKPTRTDWPRTDGLNRPRQLTWHDTWNERAHAKGFTSICHGKLIPASSFHLAAPGIPVNHILLCNRISKSFCQTSNRSKAVFAALWTESHVTEMV